MRIILVICMAVLMSSCVVEKTVSLSSKALAPNKLMDPVSSITVDAPPVGTEILRFLDSGRSTFRYTLTNDVKPEIEKVIKSVYPINQSSPKRLNVKVDLKYFPTAQGIVSSKVTLIMTVNIDMLSGELIEKTDKYVLKVEEEYSTVAFTFPRENNLQSLFEKAYKQLANDMTEK